MADEPRSQPWGAQTDLAIRHFAVGGAPMPRPLIEAIVSIKVAAARANARLGRLPAEAARAITQAAREALAMPLEALFPLSPWQSGSGTQTHMNVNEVLAHLAKPYLPPGCHLHPNDDVNRGQSSNDVMPSAIHVAAALAVQQELLPALDAVSETLRRQAQRFVAIVKLGRTHLQDAVPLTLAQEVGAWRSQLSGARRAINTALPQVMSLPLGGTAVGTGVNTHPQFGETVCQELAAFTGVPFKPVADRFAAISGHVAAATLHAALKLLAVSLSKMANDIRLLSSGPNGGLSELTLPSNEPGSSIMPGKVNPTQCEMLAMVCCQVIGNDAAVTLGAAGGQLQLNTYQPLIAVNLLQSLRLLSDAMRSFEAHALRGLGANEERIGALLKASLMGVTALAPHIGYDKAAQIVARARESGLALRDAAAQLGLAGEDFDRWTDPVRLLHPA
jgi:fumarate hydratase, class II